MIFPKRGGFPGDITEITGLGSSSSVLVGLKKRRVNLTFVDYKEKITTTLSDYMPSS